MPGDDLRRDACRIAAPGPASSIDISVNSAEPTAIRMLVRSPASFCRNSRSKPSTAPEQSRGEQAADQFDVGHRWHIGCSL